MVAQWFSPAKFVLGMLMCGLCACASTTAPPTEQTSNHSSVLSEAAQASSFAFNQQFESDLNNASRIALQANIDSLLIARQLQKLQPVQFGNPISTAKAAADVKVQLVSGILDLSKTFKWRYLHSELLADNRVAAYYRIDSKDGYSYIQFFQDPQSFKIYDFHPVSFAFSALIFVTRFSELFSKYNDKQAQLNELVSAMQRNDIAAILSSYAALDADLQSDAALTDFILRKYSQMPAETAQALRSELVKVYEQQNKTSLLFEAYYIQQDNFTQAIKTVEGLPPFARQDSKMESELAILHAYNRDYAEAILYGRQAIFAEPNEDEAYFVLLQVALLAKDYALGIEVMDVLVAKFDYLMGREVIAEFEESDNFMRSDEYREWLKKRQAS